MSASERRVVELEAKVAELQHLLAQHMRSGDDLWMESGVSSQTFKPFVHVRWGDQSGQLTTDQAKQHGLHMLEVANAAEMDAAVVAALVDTDHGLGLDLKSAIRFVGALREYRGGSRDSSASVRVRE